MSIKLNEHKQWFLEELKESHIEKTYKIYEHRLTFLEEFENLIGKEVQNFDKDDIEGFFLNLGKSTNTLYGFRSVLLQYYAFLLDNSKALGVNKFELVTQDLLKEWSNKRKEDYQFISEIEAEYIAKIFLFNNRDKAILLLSFYELSVDEISELERSNLDIENNIININGKQFKVSRYTMEVCESAYEQEEYYGSNGTSQDSGKPLKLANNGKIIKPTIYGKKSKKQGCGRNVIEGAIRLLRDISSNDIKEKIGIYYCYPLKYITPKTLNKSGRFNRLYEKEKNFGIDAREELKEEYSNYYASYKDYKLYVNKVANRNVFDIKKEVALDQV